MGADLERRFVILEQFSARRVAYGLSQSTESETDAFKIARYRDSDSAASQSKEISMKTLRLLSTTTAVLLLGAGAVSAQGMKNDETPTRAPTAQQNAPAEKIAPSMKAGERKASETTGQAANSDDKANTDSKIRDSNKAGMKAESKKPETTGQAPKTSDSNKTEMNESKEKSGAASSSGSKTGSSAKENAETKSGASGASPKSSESVNGKASTTGQGAAAGAANLSTEQRTKITTIIKQQKAEPARLNVRVSVGTRVPDSVHFYPLPAEVFVVYPEWRGYDYILVADQILVIDPRTHQIVAILEA
jgi:uncharacterized protein DUF1236